MALPSQLIRIPFDKGLDTKTDVKLVQPGKLLRCENAIFDTSGSLNTRNGYRLIPSPISGGGVGQNLGLFGGPYGELDLFVNKTLFAWLDDKGVAIPKGTARSIQSTSKSVLADGLGEVLPSCASANGVTVIVCAAPGSTLQAGAGVHATVIDEASGAIVQSKTMLSNSGQSPRVCVVQTGPSTPPNIVVFWYEVQGAGTQVGVIASAWLPTNNPSNAFTPGGTAAASDVNPGSPIYSVVGVTNGVAALVYNQKNQGTGLRTVQLVPLTATGVPFNASLQTLPGGPTSASCMQVTCTSGGHVVVAWASAQVVYFGTYGWGGAAFNFVRAQASAPLGVTPVNITISEVTDPLVRIYFEVAGDIPIDQQVQTFSPFSCLLGSLVGQTVQWRSVGLGSEAFPYQGQVYVGLAYQSQLQGAWFLGADDGTILARNLIGSFAGLTGAQALISPNSNNVDLSVVTQPFQLFLGSVAGFQPRGAVVIGTDLFGNPEVIDYSGVTQQPPSLTGCTTTATAILTVGGIARQATPFLPGVGLVDSAGDFSIAVVKNGALRTGPSNVIQTNPGIARINLAMAVERCRNTKLGEDLFVCGAVPLDYDGAYVFEHGFHVFPERPSVTGGAPIGIEVSTGPHQYNGTAGSPPTGQQVVSITLPLDISTAVPPIYCGAQIPPASYIVMGWNDADLMYGISGCFYVYFVVDGVGSDPVPFGSIGTGQVLVAGVPCILSSADTTEIVANKLAACIATFVQQTASKVAFQTTIGAAPNYVLTTTYLSVVAPGAPLVPSPIYPFVPVQGTQLGIQVCASGVTGGSPAPPAPHTADAPRISLMFPAGASINPGDSFILGSTMLGAALPSQINNHLFWYSVDGQGTAPPQSGTFVASHEISINSSWSPTQVAGQSVGVILAVQDNGMAVWEPGFFRNTVDPYTFGPGAGQQPTGGFSIIACGPGYTPGGAYTAMAYGVPTYLDASDPTSGVNPGTVVQQGGVLLAGQRAYVATYEDEDNTGQIHESAPSAPTFAVTGTPNGQNSISVPTLRLTARTAVNIVLWRTTAGTTSYQRLATIPNNATVDSVSFKDDVSDINLLSAQYLYTDGGTLPNSPPPGSPIVLRRGQRLFVVDPDDPSLVWYSQEWVKGQPVNFSNLLTIRVDQDGGDIIDLRKLDDKISILKSQHVLAFTGNGPDSTGANGEFDEPQPISTVIGSMSADSAAEMDQGVMFQTPKGYYLLARNLALVPIGLPAQGKMPLVVSTALEQQVTSAVVLSTTQQIRFTFAAGAPQSLPGILYDYIEGQWGSIQGDRGIPGPRLYGTAGCLWNGLHAVMRSDGSVLVETPNAYTDAGSFISTLIQTAYLPPFGIQGYGKMFKFWILGSYLSDHNLHIEVFYDYKPDPDWDVIINPNTMINQGAYGATSPFGGDPVYGGYPGYDGIYQFRGQPHPQRGEAFSFLLQSLPPPNGAPIGGAAYSLAALELEVQPWPSGKRLPINKLIEG